MTSTRIPVLPGFCGRLFRCFDMERQEPDSSSASSSEPSKKLKPNGASANAHGTQPANSQGILQSTVTAESTADVGLPDQERTTTNAIQEGSRVKRGRRSRKSSSAVIDQENAGQPDQERTATSAIQEESRVKKGRRSKKSSSHVIEPDEVGQPDVDRTANSALQGRSQLKKRRRSRKSISEVK
ncbi:hypothetical protein HPB51_011516 [Rhipicephalus microplus]|uniref:Uncharacterized protein n=1 Tax=Rhipicephalus microplus TaxID=6941 RepID=A0A9J6E8W5_RHIMP|nr:hypothetical protein HPB51_011516 [Rhipicephalus microplus]